MLRAASSAVSICALLAAAPALAASLEARSRIDSVTVYPDGASVSRAIEVDLPGGETSLVLRDLPLGLDPASLRVEGEGAGALTIGSVQTRVAPVQAGAPEPSAAARLQALRDERASVQARIEALEGRRAMVQRYAEASPEKLGSDAAPLDVDKWSAAWDAVGRELARSGEDLRVARISLREADEKIAALEASTRPPDPRGRPAREAVVELEAQAPGKARILVTYRVAGAGWRPTYDARLLTRPDGAKASLELVRRAQVRQTTGEDWSGVNLAVSTARTQRGAKAPEVHTERLAFFEPPMLSQAAPRANADVAERLKSARVASPPAPAAVAMAPAQQQEAVLDAGAYEANFRAPGRIDVPGDGSERGLRLGARTLAADVTVRTAPALDQTAYLDVAFVNEDEAPLLPGEVAIHRDGMFVGRSRLELAAPGGDVRLGFGADDAVKVTRAPVRRKENEPSWFGSTKQEVREFRTVVRNQHAFAVKANVIDRIPISENSAIVIEQLPATTPPTARNVDERRGVLSWTFDLAPGATKDIVVAYRMKWPADREVTFETLPNEGDRPAPQPRPVR
ncbi:MAG: hypothetical protein JWN93_2566 [Hyphomicrobiales bacterium]|nr:hypothetical protein [Hyphomicrobiales bacterium]